MCNMNCCMKYKLQTPTLQTFKVMYQNTHNRHMNMCNKLSCTTFNIIWANRWSMQSGAW